MLFCLAQVHPGQVIKPHEYRRIMLIALPSLNSSKRDNGLRHDSGNRFGGIENSAVNGSESQVKESVLNGLCNDCKRSFGANLSKLIRRVKS